MTMKNALMTAYSELQSKQCSNPESYYSGFNGDKGCKVTMGNITKIYYAAGGGEWQKIKVKGRCDDDHRRD